MKGLQYMDKMQLERKLSAKENVELRFKLEDTPDRVWIINNVYQGTATDQLN